MSISFSIDAAADQLFSAHVEALEMEPLTDFAPDLDLDLAYRVQNALLRRHIASGDRVVGLKLGLTPEAKQKQMGITYPITGYLTARMMLSEGEGLPFDSMIHPKCEPEIAFVMGDALEGRSIDPDEAMAAVATIHSAIEVIDSRYRDFRFKLPDVVADNASSSKFVLGHAIDPVEIASLAEEECVLRLNRNEVARASGAAVQGHPGHALALAVNDMATRGQRIEAGWIVLTGGLTDAVRIEAGDRVDAEYSRLSQVTIG